MPVGPQRSRKGMSEESRLTGRVTRARNNVNRIVQEYGSYDIPLDNPLFAQRKIHQEKHMAALKALREYRESQGIDWSG